MYIGSINKCFGKRIIYEIKEYIDNFYYTDINLNSISEKYHINLSYLSQSFKSEIGENFVDYLKRVRISKAKELLKTTDLKAYKIGEMVGYSNFRYFYSIFTKVEGVTPSDYRQQRGN